MKTGLGERLKSLRGSEKMYNQAKRFAIHSNTLGRYEREEVSPPADFIAMVSALYGATADWLLFGRLNQKTKVPSSVSVCYGENSGFPERLKYALGARSVRGLAKNTGISGTAIGKYLSGASEPTRPVLISLASALEVPVGWLVAGNIEEGMLDVRINGVKFVCKGKE